MFRWENFSKALLREIARDTGLRVTFAADDLAERFGTPPTVNLVDAAWPLLRDRWLGGAPGHRKNVVSALRSRGLGSKTAKVASKAGQMEFLQSCRLSPNLREIVLKEFIAAGSAEESQTTATSTAPRSRPGGDNVSDDDIGIAAVEAMYSGMMIDDAWAVRRPRGFTWWAFRHAQHIDADEPTPSDDGALGSTITIRTEILRDVPEADRLKATSVINRANPSQALSALVCDGESGTIDSYSVVRVHADTADLWTPLLMVSAVVQNLLAQVIWEDLALQIPGQPSHSAHPANGMRPLPDELLDVAAIAGQQSTDDRPSFSGPLMSELLRFAEQWSFANGEDTAFTGEVPFTGTRTSIEAMVHGEGPIETAMVQVDTASSHPLLGSGAFIAMKLPLNVTEEEAVTVAAALNALEAAGRAPSKLLGSWCSFEDAVAFLTFLPAVTARSGLLPNLYLDAAVRARWVNEALYGPSDPTTL